MDIQPNEVCRDLFHTKAYLTWEYEQNLFFWLFSGYVSPLGTFALKEKKPPIVNNQCVVYKFECDLCDADYVGYTARHQRSNEHKYSAIGRHLEQHGLLKTDLVNKQFSVLKKRRSKFDCLIFEMPFIKELNPKLNIQKVDSTC